MSVTGADEVIGELTVSELDSYIKDILFREFGIKVPLTDIKIDWADDCMIINEITVFIESKDGGHKDDVEKYLEDIIDESIMVEIL